MHLPGRKYIKGHRPLVPTKQGYRRVYAPGHPLANKDGNILEHRKVLHDAGIQVPPGWHVHHRNENKLDNRLENLEVLPPRMHTREHLKRVGYVVNQFGRWPVRRV